MTEDQVKEVLRLADVYARAALDVVDQAADVEADDERAALEAFLRALK